MCLRAHQVKLALEPGGGARNPYSALHGWRAQVNVAGWTMQRRLLHHGFNAWSVEVKGRVFSGLQPQGSLRDLEVDLTVFVFADAQGRIRRWPTAGPKTYLFRPFDDCSFPRPKN